MSELKHTPGPWMALIDGESTWGSDSHSVVAGEHSAGIADVMIECEASTHGEDGVTHVTQEQGIANAHLIAAAPDLLEAGSNLLEAFNSAFGINETWADERIYDEMPTSGLALAYFAIRAAIAKATQP